MRLKLIGFVIAGATIGSATALTLVVAAAKLSLGVHAGPHTTVEVMIVGGLQVMIAVGTAIPFAIVLSLGGRRLAVQRVALTLALLLVGGLVSVEIFGQASSGSTDFTAIETLTDDLPVLLLIGVPSLLIVMMEWWFALLALSNEPRSSH
jgi:hypothetical protein